MLNSLVNRSKRHTDDKVQEVIRAINRQIAQDFQPCWSFGAQLRLEDALGRRAKVQSMSDMRGDGRKQTLSRSGGTAAIARTRR